MKLMNDSMEEYVLRSRNVLAYVRGIFFLFTAHPHSYVPRTD